ncbi:DUF1189 family protein [Planococcus salinus]|uniref:DUF1189 domain-containing protein n=1 Tax=Planococcus salinus TaxID=1848460 RepID=A0A3M8PCF8_9BACL|nr:DUF1189 family protein [Planococcus salinus]RNF41283.1 DUF1189 domain-containing protein [Planococcus salinus]
MNLFQLFKASFMEPKKQAAVRIMTIGKIMRFVFMIILLMTAISFVELAFNLDSAAIGVEGLLEFVEQIEWLLYPFALIFLFVSTTLYHFVKISLFALIGVGLLQMRKRKGEYRHMWRTAALSVTIPTLVSFVLSFFGMGLWVSLITSLLTVIYLYLAAGYYPKMPPAQRPKN